VLRDLGLTSNQVWGLTKTDEEWSEKLEAALTTTRRMTSSTAPTRFTSTAAHAASVERISASVWLGTGANPCIGCSCGARGLFDG
jgi:hypothetical protein